MKFRPMMIVPLALTLGFFGLAAVQLSRTEDARSIGVDTAALPSTREGRVAPHLDLAALDDTPLLTRADLEGNGLIILNFFASWCPPCRAEHPTLTALAEAGNPLFGVNYRDQLSQARAFLSELGNPYDRIGRDEEARNGRDWGVVAMPETFFINSEGVVVLHFRGPITQRVLANQVLPSLQEKGYDLVIPEGFEATEG
ncbi:DsbE family thiol:disulfide interchange protein [Rhodobacterales bacterium HKCCA1065]|nr:DsbE family thiol:disulfide interchange protein [Rhodobacterales bacterium HKCCA1065]